MGTVALAGCDTFSPRTPPPPCDPDTDPNCQPPPEFVEPLVPEIVRDNIKAAVEGRTVQPNYERSLTPEPADQVGVFAYLPDPGAEAHAPPNFFVGWDKGKEVQFMLTLLETSGDSLRSVELVFQRYTQDPGFPATNDLKRYDVDYVLSLTYGNPPAERIDVYAGRAKWDKRCGGRWAGPCPLGGCGPPRRSPSA